jgi:exodeoxyribonuclease V beta subunit
MIKSAKSLGEFASIGRDIDEQGNASEADATTSTSQSPVVLASFPRGAKTGDFLHSLLEHIDFCNAPSHPDAVRRELGRFGFDPGDFGSTVSEALQQILATPLGSALPPLGEVGLRARCSEMEFTLPIAQGGEQVAGRAPSAAKLGELFTRHPRSVNTGYGDALRQLGFSTTPGYLRGFIDLVFESGGRYYVVDYKSNYLGDQPEDYRPELLKDVMAHHHYHLQAHLYALAVHRYLRTRIKGYSYGTHFGGAYYLFLRGMSPAHPLGTGVFEARPSAALIEEISALFDGVGGPS